MLRQIMINCEINSLFDVRCCNINFEANINCWSVEAQLTGNHSKFRSINYIQEIFLYFSLSRVYLIYFPNSYCISYLQRDYLSKPKVLHWMPVEWPLTSQCLLFASPWSVCRQYRHFYRITHFTILGTRTSQSTLCSFITTTTPPP